MIRYGNLITFPKWQIPVYIGTRKSGRIVPVKGGGFQYVTASGNSGEVFATVALVKRSLETE